MKREAEEEEAKKNKKRQEILELIHVFIAFIIIIGMAVGIVVLDNVLFPEEKVITFVPLEQKVQSTGGAHALEHDNGQLLTFIIMKENGVLASIFDCF